MDTPTTSRAEIDLDIEVKTILEGRKGDWLAISKAAEVSHSWLSKFVNGHIPNPGYATLKRIHAVLTAATPEPQSGTAAAQGA